MIPPRQSHRSWSEPNSRMRLQERASRRDFLQWTAGACAAATGSALFPAAACAQHERRDAAVDAAIVRGLEFLERRQQPAGSYIADNLGESTAVTGLAATAFMAAGHLPGEGTFGATILRGLRWIVSRQEENGMLVYKRSHGPMYSHGISTLTLAEALGLLPEADHRPTQVALERSLRLILQAQAVSKRDRHAGGWRYQVSSTDSDLSVTGWQLLALRAAKDIGCDIPAEAIDAAIAYVKLCAVERRGGFAYQPDSGPTPTRSGIGITCLEVCGVHQAPESIAAADYLLENRLEFDESYFFYGAYYCSIGMFKLGGDYWPPTRDHLAGILLDKQQPDGSWVAQHATEAQIGPGYCTAMAILALAVDYQYLPIYQR